jgi:hypothetical protein
MKPPKVTPKRLIIVAVAALAIIAFVFCAALYYMEPVKA